MKLKNILLVLLLLSAVLSFGKDQDRVRVSFSDNGKALINPDMGWTMHFYSNIVKNYGSRLEPSDTLEWFDGCSTIYLRLPWSFIEPKEGEFNWAIVDTPAQRWIAAGKKVAFRFTCYESWLEYATPKWVEEAGAKMIRYDFGKGPDPNGKLCDPIYDDPVFLKKLENFLSEAGKRYNGNPNIAFIDVGTFGMWGEGHTFFSSRLNQEQTDRMVRIHVDLHLKYFPDTFLCISDDVIGSTRPGDDFPTMNYCLKKGVSLRDDSILVQAPPKSWYHAALAQKFWPKMPVIIEHEHYKSSVDRNAWSDELLLKSVEEYHGSYMSIHWFPDVLWKERSDIIKKINLRLGYRLLPSEIVFPASVKIGEYFDAESKWSNVAVAPCYPGGYWALTFKDKKNGIVAVLVDDSFNFRDLKTAEPGKAPIKELKTKFRAGLIAPVTKPGIYDVFLSVGQRDGTPVFALPINAPEDGARRYKIGQIELRDK